MKTLNVLSSHMASKAGDESASASTQCGMISGDVLFLLLFIAGLATLEFTFWQYWGYLPNDDNLTLILSASFGLGGITVAVVGLLLSLWVTTNMKGTEGSSFFRWLIISLLASIFVGFSAGMCALAALGGIGGQELREAVPYLFIGTLYMISIGLTGSVVAILK